MRWPFRIWAFGEAVALRGLLASSRATGAEEPLGFVRALLRTYVGRGVGRSAEEHVAPGAELLALHALDGESTWLDAARALARLHMATPPGPDGVRYLRPDLPGWRRQIWVDSMDGGPPFLARLAHVTGDDTYAHEATTTLLAYARLLQDERSGLFVHGFEEHCGRNGQLWARGNGWAAMGLVETLAWVPREARLAGELRQRLAALLDGLAVLQQSSGLWPTVLDRPESPLETTLAVMTTTAIDRARQAGVLPGGLARVDARPSAGRRARAGIGLGRTRARVGRDTDRRTADVRHETVRCLSMGAGTAAAHAGRTQPLHFGA